MAKKKKDKNLTSDEWYLEFIKAIRVTEHTQTAKQFNAAFESAEKALAYITGHADEYDSAELRLVQRAMQRLQSLKEEQ